MNQKEKIEKKEEMLALLSLEDKSLILEDKVVKQLDNLLIKNTIESEAAFILHDIASPLSALNILVEKDTIREKNTTLIKILEYLSQILTVKYLGKPTKSLFDPNNTIVNCLDIMNPIIEKHNINVRVKTHCSTFLYGSEIRFVRVLYNLIANSVESVRKNIDPLILIDTYSTNSNKITLRIMDNGVGINNKKLKHNTYRPFNVVDKGHYGLGLFICKSIIENEYNGTLKIDSIKSGEIKTLIKIII